MAPAASTTRRHAWLSNRMRFTWIWRQNFWRDPETRSGPGSRRDSRSVADTIGALDLIVRQHNVRSVADIPCGDFNWQPELLSRHPRLEYRGFDIVAPLIAANRKRHPGQRFDVLDITSAIPPRTDLILCKDLLNHLHYDDVGRALENMRASGSQWLLASNNFGAANTDISRSPLKSVFYTSRLLDICAPPLSCPEPIWSTHYLGLWRLSDFAR